MIARLLTCISFIASALLFEGCQQSPDVSSTERGEVGTYHDKFIWTGSQQAFVPNYLMIDMLDKDLSKITEDNLAAFIDEFLVGHGFNGLHIPVLGQWFHIGDPRVTENDTLPDQKTLDKLSMIIQMVYEAGGCAHLWMWGDDQRSQTSKSTRGGIMGAEERLLLDKIHEELNPLLGWTMGYGFDLFEWVSESQLDAWHDYLWSKPGWNHLLGARSWKNTIDQMSEKMDYSSYEYHKPWYDTLVIMREARPRKPSFSEDRYRKRTPTNWPMKDYSFEEMRRGLWHHTMAGGVAAIWGNLDGDGIFPNKEAIHCFFTFWDDHKRFHRDLVVTSAGGDGMILSAGSKIQVVYKENAVEVRFNVERPASRTAKAVDTRKSYKEIRLPEIQKGENLFNAPYESDWAIVIE
jgi:hypothetical protein